MLKIKCFVNELMSSNCYLVYDEITRQCVIIDPASQYSLEEIKFIERNNLSVDYIILTHEHTDHTWGVNSLLQRFDLKVVCHKECALALNSESRAYFQFYYDDPSYEYVIEKIDLLVDENSNIIDWNGRKINFMYSPGHSKGSMCVKIDNVLFTGDTIMQYKPYISRKNGSLESFHDSVNCIKDLFLHKDIIVYPGHGESFCLDDYFCINN